jgi:DHA1 family tetracycline resistance protein-like MFS transporter
MFRAFHSRKAALSFIFITVVLDMLAVGMIIPVLPKLVMMFLGGDTSKSAKMIGLFGTVWALMQLLFSPVMGSLSDRFGRRPVILISNFGLGLDYILMAMAPTLTWLFVGRTISGITSASISTANAYIADVTPPDKRAGSYGLLGAAFGIGFILGPAMGGLLGSISPRLPFWVAAGLSLSNAAYGFFVLPESLPMDRRARFVWTQANPLGSFVFVWSRPKLFGFSTLSFLRHLAHQVLNHVFVLYAGYRYGWNERAVGLTLACVGLCSGLVQGALIRPVVSRIGERNTLLLGLAFGICGFATFGMAKDGMQFLVGIPMTALWGLSGPALQGLMTQRAGPDEQGQLQGAQSSVMGLAGLMGPAIFTQTFAYFIEPAHHLNHPGAPFFLAAMIMVISLAIAWMLTRSLSQKVPLC